MAAKRTDPAFFGRRSRSAAGCAGVGGAAAIVACRSAGAGSRRQPLTRSAATASTAEATRIRRLCPPWSRLAMRTFTLLLQLIDVPADTCRRIAVRFRAVGLVADDALPVDVERCRRIVDAERPLGLGGSR